MTTKAGSYAVNTYAYTMSHSAEACLEHLATSGHNTFELMMYPGHAWPGTMSVAARSNFLRFLDRRDLRVVSLNMPNIDINVAGVTEEMRRYSLAMLESFVRLAGDLEVPGVVVGPGKANPLFPAPQEQLVGYFFKALDVLAPIAAEVGTALWVENMPFAFLPRADQMMQAIERHGDPRIGVVYDLANGAFVKESPGEGLRRVKERLSLIHLSDTPLDVYRHAPVGEGVVAFADAVPVLREIGYAGPSILEIISNTPDRDIADSVEGLKAVGWGGVARP